MTNTFPPLSHLRCLFYLTNSTDNAPRVGISPSAKPNHRPHARRYAGRRANRTRRPLANKISNGNKKNAPAKCSWAASPWVNGGTTTQRASGKSMSSPIPTATATTPTTNQSTVRHPSSRPSTNKAATCVVGAHAMKTKAVPGVRPWAINPAATGTMAKEQAYVGIPTSTANT